jgi:hypothetical protein
MLEKKEGRQEEWKQDRNVEGRRERNEVNELTGMLMASNEVVKVREKSGREYIRIISSENDGTDRNFESGCRVELYTCERTAIGNRKRNERQQITKKTSAKDPKRERNTGYRRFRLNGPTDLERYS